MEVEHRIEQQRIIREEKHLADQKLAVMGNLILNAWKLQAEENDDERAN